MAKGLSGLAVSAIGVGGILIFAGFRGVNPVRALREIGGGTPTAATSLPLDLSRWASAGVAVGNAVGSVPGALAVSAAQKYAGDKYSQARRTQPGYSDCSSFVDKAFRDAGIPTPTKWAATANYRMSPDWKNITAAESRPGDIAISSGHMVLVTANGGTAAIGQQNSRVNVRTGSVANLMSGYTSYVYKRYSGGGQK